MMNRFAASLFLLLLINLASAQHLLKIDGKERDWAFSGSTIDVYLAQPLTKELQIVIGNDLYRVICGKNGKSPDTWNCKLPDSILSGVYSISLLEDGIKKSPSDELIILDRISGSVLSQFDRTIFDIDMTQTRIPIVYIDENKKMHIPINSTNDSKQPYLLLLNRFESLNDTEKNRYIGLMQKYTRRFSSFSGDFYKKFTGPEMVVNDSEASQIRFDFSGIMEKDYIFYPLIIKNGRIDFEQPTSFDPINGQIDSLDVPESMKMGFKSLVSAQLDPYRTIKSIYPINYSRDNLTVDWDNVPGICHKPIAEFSINVLDSVLYSQLVGLSTALNGKPSPTTEPFTGTATDDLLVKYNLSYLKSKKSEVLASANYYMGFSERDKLGSAGVDIYIADTSYEGVNGKIIDSFSRKINNNGQQYLINGHGSIVADILNRYINDGISIFQRQSCSSEECSLARVSQVICGAILQRIATGRHVIVNLSMTYAVKSSLLDKILSEANKKGVWFVVSNGNADRFKSQSISVGTVGFIDQRQYPAYDSIKYNRMINVGGVFIDEKMRLSDFADNGITSLPRGYEAKIYAPAMYMHGDDESLPHLGTSFSAPYVSAALANLLTELPADCQATVKDILPLISSARKIIQGVDVPVVNFSAHPLTSKQIIDLCK